MVKELFQNHEDERAQFFTQHPDYYPLFTTLKKLAPERTTFLIQEGLNQEVDEEDGEDEEEEPKNCDEIFSKYLTEISKRVNENFYNEVLKFMIAFRECLNEFGWQKKAEHEKLDYDPMEPLPDIEYS